MLFVVISYINNINHIALSGITDWVRYNDGLSTA